MRIEVLLLKIELLGKVKRSHGQEVAEATYKEMFEKPILTNNLVVDDQLLRHWNDPSTVQNFKDIPTLQYAFSWALTEQSEKYWSELHEQMRRDHAY